MHCENQMTLRMVPNLLINFLKQLQFGTAVVYINSKELLEAIVENTLSLEDANAVPYFVLLEFYLVNKDQVTSLSCKECITKHQK